MIKRMVLLGLCVGLFASSFGVEARAYPANHNNVYYRNAKERILVKVADRVIDKVFDHYDENGKAKPFHASVRSNISVFANYPFMRPQTITVTEEISDGYRRDPYTGSIDIGNVLAKRLSELGMKCIIKAPAEKDVPAALELRYSVTHYGPRNVSLWIIAKDTSAEQDIMEYSGTVTSSDMDEGQKLQAVQAIVVDFKNNYANLQ